MEDVQPEVTLAASIDRAITRTEAPPQETAPRNQAMAEALEIAKAKAEAESAKRDAAHQAAQAKLG